MQLRLLTYPGHDRINGYTGWLWIGLVCLSVGLPACAELPQTSSAGSTDVTLVQLQHHRWLLQAFDGISVPTDRQVALDQIQLPELDFGEQRHVEGFAGCNRFQGRLELVGANQFRVTGISSTRMVCENGAMLLEQRYLQMLQGWSAISLDKEYLILHSDGQQWLFRLADWVH
jgi:heat shock protein HslJ